MKTDVLKIILNNSYNVLQFREWICFRLQTIYMKLSSNCSTSGSPSWSYIGLAIVILVSPLALLVPTVSVYNDNMHNIQWKQCVTIYRTMSYQLLYIEQWVTIYKTMCYNYTYNSVLQYIEQCVTIYKTMCYHIWNVLAIM